MNEKEQTKDIIKQAMSGDQSAFAWLYETHYKSAYFSAKDILNKHEECEDVVQEAFLNVFSKLQNGQEITDFGAYIKTATKNAAKDLIKSREAKKRPDEVLSTFKIEEDDDSTGEMYDSERSEIQDAILKASEFYQTPEEMFEQKELQNIVQDILSDLPDYQQESLNLFYIEGMKYREIAQLYGVSVDTIKSRVNQGKKKVEKKIIELEKAQKIKLRSVAPLPFFFWLLRKTSEVQAASMVPSGSAFVSSNAILSKTGHGIINTIKSFFAKSVHFAGKTISMKAITIATAGIIGASGIISGVIYNQVNVQNTNNEDIQDSYFDTDDFSFRGIWRGFCEYNIALDLDATYTWGAVTSDNSTTIDLFNDIYYDFNKVYIKETADSITMEVRSLRPEDLDKELLIGEIEILNENQFIIKNISTNLLFSSDVDTILFTREQNN